MTNESFIHVRVDAAEKQAAEQVLTELGLNMAFRYVSAGRAGSSSYGPDKGKAASCALASLKARRNFREKTYRSIDDVFRSPWAEFTVQTAKADPTDRVLRSTKLARRLIGGQLPALADRFQRGKILALGNVIQNRHVELPGLRGADAKMQEARCAAGAAGDRYCQ